MLKLYLMTFFGIWWYELGLKPFYQLRCVIPHLFNNHLIYLISGNHLSQAYDVLCTWGWGWGGVEGRGGG